MKKRTFSVICLLLCLGIILNFSQSFHKIQAASAELVKGTVVIDPGHGGEDGGAVGINQVMEKDINLPIALLLRDLFVNNGYRVVMTREEDCDLGDQSLNSVAERKRSDMRSRVELIGEAKADLVLSIHQNHFEQSKYKGAQIFYAAEQSKNLAEVLQKTIISDVQPENNRLAKKSDSIFLLNKTQIPAVIVECGFISNPEEAEKLTQADYQQQLAEAIYKGACEYLGKEQGAQPQ